MSETIWKFPLTHVSGNVYETKMPRGARALTADWQDHSFVAWAAVDPDDLPEARYFHIAGTGHPLPLGLGVGGRLLNRIEIKVEGSPLIFHVFDTGRWLAHNPPAMAERVELPRG